jgi:hypothetical protein
MTTPGDATTGPLRPLLLPAVRGLIAEARSERALLPVDSAERQFYLGVEGAAEEVVQPQLAGSREEQWLERQPPAFRDGFVRTADLLARLATNREPPRRIPLPEPPPPGSR